MKIKASKLLKELLTNSQKAFNSEDKNIQSAINDTITCLVLSSLVFAGGFGGL